MKKILSYTLVFIISFFSFYMTVSAYTVVNDRFCENDYKDDNKNNFNYAITNFNMISSNDDVKFIFDGWAIIDHVDNYGGKNLTTKFIVSLGGVYNGKEFPVTFINNDSKDYNIYYSRSSHKTSVERAGVSGLVSRANSIGNNFQNYVTNGSKGNIDALYYRVHFTVTISLNDIIGYFEDELDVNNSKQILYFYIMSEIDKPSRIVRYADVGIHPNYCAAGIKCPSIGNSIPKEQVLPKPYVFPKKNGDTISLDKLYFTSLNGKFLETAITATVKHSYNGGYLSQDYDYFYKPGVSYTLVDGYQYYGNKYYKVWCGKANSNTGGWVDGKCASNPAYSPGGSEQCYIPVDWGSISGGFSIELNFEEAKNDCTCLGSKCVVKGAGNSCSVRKLPNTDTCRDGSGGTCGSASVNFDCDKQSLKNVYYISASRDQLIKEGLAKDKYLTGATNIEIADSRVTWNRAGDTALIPVDFYVDVHYSHRGSLELYKEGMFDTFVNNSKIVDANTPFGFALKYQLTTAFTKANTAFNRNNENYKNYTEIYVKYTKNGVRRGEYVRIYFDFAGSDSIVYKSSPDWQRKSVSDIGDYIVEHISDSENLPKYFNGGYHEHNFEFLYENLIGKFPDSNTKDSVITSGTPKINPGYFRCKSEDTSVREGFISTTCTYKIRESHFVPENLGICYGTSCSGPKTRYFNQSAYFLPKYLDTKVSTASENAFPFEIYGNLNLIKGHKYDYKGVCGLKKVINQLKDGHLVYRPINVKDPFPDTEIRDYPTNWKEYIDDTHDNALLRVKNTFSGSIFYETNVLSTKDVLNPRLSFELGDYYSISDLIAADLSGRSAYIRESGFFTTTTNRYCKYGEFKKDCSG